MNAEHDVRDRKSGKMAPNYIQDCLQRCSPGRHITSGSQSIIPASYDPDGRVSTRRRRTGINVKQSAIRRIKDNNGRKLLAWPPSSDGIYIV